MLWINLIMDSLGSLALATEPPYDELLHRQPTKKNESIINGKMWKHILFQSIIQLLLLVFLYLYAPHFIPEDNYVRLAENRLIEYCYGALPGKTKVENIIFGIDPKWSNEYNLKGKKEFCGNYGEKQDLSMAYDTYIHNNANSSHMTIIFNVFVIYTLFNQINCRVIDDNFNIFVRIGNNIFFPIITLSELVLQIFLIQFGGDAFKCSESGLSLMQWLISIGFSLFTFILSFIIKIIPIDVCIQNILDNASRGNKVAGIDDLLHKNDLTDNGSKDNEKNQNKIRKSLIDALRKNSDTSFDISPREKKPKLILAYD
jgi:Ca2+ transporting ATPase